MPSSLITPDEWSQQLLLLRRQHQTEWLAYVKTEARSRLALGAKHLEQQTTLRQVPFDARNAAALIHQQLDELIEWRDQAALKRAAIRARHLQAEANPTH